MAEKQAKLLKMLSEGSLNERMFNASFGLRLEEHRILTNGRASRYEYPKNLSSRKTNPYLLSGFSDNLMEFTTPIVRGSKATCQQLKVLEQIVDSQLHEDERIWPLSLAPAPEYQHDLEFVGNNCSQPWNKEYTNYLREKYGIKRMILGGAHIGFNLDQELLDALYDQSFKDDFATRADFQNAVYFKMAQCFCLWRWLFTYLYGASPVSEAVEHDMPEHINLQCAVSVTAPMAMTICQMSGLVMKAWTVLLIRSRNFWKMALIMVRKNSLAQFGCMVSMMMTACARSSKMGFNLSVFVHLIWIHLLKAGSVKIR